jgi:lipid II:glycine glycyltransferase (peptidoglycan interpeptide bridge formation enzyme)
MISSVVDLRQSPQWAKFMKDLGWEVEKIDNCQIFIKKLPLSLGSFVKILRPNPPIPFGEIDKIAKKHRAWFVKLEPNVTGNELRITNYELRRRGFHSSSWPLVPTKTLQINLTPPKEMLFKQCEKRARNAIRKAEKMGLVIGRSKSIEQFCKLWTKNMRRKGNLLASGREIKSLWEAFGRDAYLLIAKEGKINKPVGGTLLIKHGKTFHYMHAASSRQGNKLCAPSLLLWESILLGKKLNCQIFDLEGAYDPRFPKAQKGWRGFSHFKKGFGGKEVEYLGSFIKYYNRFLSPFLIFAF